MKASKILAGLSALSIAASMLSMVASADDDLAATAPASVDDGTTYGIAGEDPEVDEVGETVATEDAADYDSKFGKDYGWFKDFGWAKKSLGYDWNMWSGIKGYSSYMPTSKYVGWFWPGYPAKEMPINYKLYETYLQYKDSAWEVWGTKQDNTIPGYIVFEFEGDQKWVIPAAVDKNGEVTTDEIFIPKMGVEKIYFLYEVSDAPAFGIKLEKFTVNGKDVPINKDNLADNKYAYDPTAPDGKKAYIQKEFAENLLTYDAETGEIVYDDVLIEDIPIFYQATIFQKSSLADDYTDDNKYDDKKPIGVNNQDESAINHNLTLFGTKVKITFTVSGIGSESLPVHWGIGKGDEKGDVHTHIDPDEAGGLGTQEKNLDKYPVNPHFAPSDTCSKDLYDALVEVYNSDPDHKTDAEIKFKTVSDKNGVLVANFLNVWELDQDADGNSAHWLKDFENGYAVYVEQKEIVVGYQKATKKFYVPGPDGKPVKDEKGAYQYEEKEIDLDGKFKDHMVGPNGEDGWTADLKENKEKHWVFATNDERKGKVIGENKEALEPLADGTYKDMKFLAEDKVEEAYCWHPYFVTENGLVDIVTKNYLGNYKTNVPDYTALTDAQIKYLADNNGMYYNDNIHHAAYGHFVVFGDNTLREYSYRIKADAVKAMLDAVQRSNVAREDFIYRHAGKDIEGFNKDFESFNPTWLDRQAAKDNKDENPFNAYHYEHHRAVHGSIWLQCCEGTILKDVAVHAHTDITKQGDLPKLYGKENYEAMYPKKPADSSSAAAAGAAAQPTEAAAATDENAPSGAAAGFGIAGLLLAGAAMVVAKKKS